MKSPVRTPVHRGNEKRVSQRDLRTVASEFQNHLFKFAIKKNLALRRVTLGEGLGSKSGPLSSVIQVTFD